jgi:hypothetical protein
MDHVLDFFCGMSYGFLWHGIDPSAAGGTEKFHCPIFSAGPLAPAAHEKRIFAGISGWIGLGRRDS